jgi:hypothetical protein
MKITSILGCSYPANVSLKIDRAIKVFHDKQKLKQYTTTKPPLPKNLQGILHTESESNKTTKGQAIPNRRRKGKKGESNIESATDNQILKKTKTTT